MSKVENILEINKKIIAINFTNLESLEIMKDEKVSDYITKLSECYEKNSEDNTQYFNCIIKSVCPEQTESFKQCKKDHENELEVCAPNLIHLNECMKSYSNKTLEVLKKAKNY